MNLLLLSNGTLPGKGYLEHALDPIQNITKNRKNALFIPFAGVTISWDDYTKKVQQALSTLDVAITPVHTTEDPQQAVRDADIIIVGGGNTFNLLKCCRERKLLTAIRQRVQQGAAYIGWSAGANLACPTICTTNDMPIIDPQGFDALNLIDFQINPHYTNKLPDGHQGETRNQRLAELLMAQPEIAIVGLPEGDWLVVDDKKIRLEGPYSAALFKAQQPPQTLDCGELRL
ncbi:dipeptidase E [Brenneria goodwinii]|uniref:dipeptidase E n=1 Tax=Brenneria goodwinii TaxID=1109412 RepID=A0AAE8ESG5_9GAMM|nr:dipeptidase PepE [Brenneria goodwinii]ATA24277.1 (alpha)-aspartyl dipeptidase [Brenneria goodwinii]RLM29581.1 dipeptidase E [Brenneria goodwinii]